MQNDNHLWSAEPLVINGREVITLVRTPAGKAGKDASEANAARMKATPAHGKVEEEILVRRQDMLRAGLNVCSWFLSQWAAQCERWSNDADVLRCQHLSDDDDSVIHWIARYPDAIFCEECAALALAAMDRTCDLCGGAAVAEETLPGLTAFGHVLFCQACSAE